MERTHNLIKIKIEEKKCKMRENCWIISLGSCGQVKVDLYEIYEKIEILYSKKLKYFNVAIWSRKS